MSNLDNITSNSNYSVVAQEQLFTELTLEEGAVLEGGVIYNLGNRAGLEVNYTINGVSDSLDFFEEKEYDFRRAPTVRFDRKIGPGVEYSSVKLSPGNNNFDVNEGILILGGGLNNVNAALNDEA
ncbi:hypothetical protein [Nostoc sp.]|uniref:hypothetical protein n=1 Tax=Nostoc sp. TaxID=1180 RepID=UPI002FF94E23